MKKNRTKIRGKSLAAVFAVLALLIAVVALNIVIVIRTQSDRIEADGQVRLSNIASRVDNSLYRSECLLDSVAMQVDRMISDPKKADSLLSEYFSPETIEDISGKSDGSCFSAYAAYNGKLYINDFVPDKNFVLEERSWYISAKKRMGAVSVTEPYIDASTGQMCYSISKLLSDGSTVVGLDFNLSGIQRYIEEMSANGSNLSLIVNDDGMIMGHSRFDYVGRNYRELEFYNELVNKVFMLYGDSFDYKANGERYNVFSEKTNYDWYLIVCVKHGAESAISGGAELYLPIVLTVVSAVILLLFVLVCKNQAAAQKALEEKDEYQKNLFSELRRSSLGIINRAKILGGSDSGEAGEEIGELANKINNMLDSSTQESPRADVRKADSQKKEKVSAKRPVRIVVITVLVNIVLLSTGALTVVFNYMTNKALGGIKMEKETELYQNQVKDWTLTNKTVLDVISESIAAQPGFSDNYEAAVKYLDSVAANHDDISVAYICNPAWEHTVIMNNGWEPEQNWHVEERQWYIDTLASRDNFSVSAPYLDERTGLYCTTLSKIVYDAKGNFLGVLGIDYYLDKLISILGESYTDMGYAFITDINGNILNHPNSEYQMKPDSSVNVADICYRNALLELGADNVIITDYDGESKVCYALREDISGFNVFVIRNSMDIFGDTIYSASANACLFLICIIIVNGIMISLIRWQSKVNSQLRESVDKAVSAGKAKNDFLANMSHEIRTPINAVLGMNEMIMRESGEQQIVEYAANIQSAGRTLLSIINDILDFSKIESGKMEIVPVEYDISSLINDIINMVKIRAEKKNLRFVPEIDEKLPSVLFGDDVRLRQIITNILTNAVKYTPEGYVRLRMSAVQIQDGILKLEVSVTDTGIGIKEDDMDKLFASFQRLDQEKNRSIEGTGLGITIVSRLLNMMGSELKVSSVYGAGSTFSFVIEQKIVNPEPIGNYELRFKASSQKASDSAGKTAPNARILMVDDNETNLLVAKNLLKRTLAMVDTVSSGKACIELLREKLYDIVFLDHMMPEQDGIETLKIIKKEELAVGTVFIALTANAISGVKQTYLDAGFDDYLSKPFTGHDIEKMLFSHLDKDMIKSDSKTDPAENGTGSENGVGSRLDIKGALERLGGDKNAYLNAVYDFCDSNRCNDLELNYGIKEMSSYRANLKKAQEEAEKTGLSELADGAKKLISAVDGKDMDYLAANHSDFIKKYRKAADNLEKAANDYFADLEGNDD